METFVVTGANRGIGLELTRQLLNANRQVIATCRTPDSEGELSKLKSDQNLSVMPLEVTDEDSVNDFRSQLSGRVVDVLINNAGEMGSKQQTLSHMDFDAWIQTLSVNTLAPFHISQALLENLVLSSRPRIISLSSQMGSLNRVTLGSYAYRSSKAALNKVMQVMAHELKPQGVIVCPVNPGWVKTDMGGLDADISVEESASGLIQLIDNLELKQSGQFWNWNGQPHPW